MSNPWAKKRNHGDEDNLDTYIFYNSGKVWNRYIDK